MRLVLLALACLALAPCGVARAGDEAQPDPDTTTPPATAASDGGLGADAKAYFTAPLHWDRTDWSLFGGALLAIGAAHHYDTQVRTHFEKLMTAGASSSSKDVEDALPTMAVGLATWAYASFLDDSAGRTEAWNMLEAAGFGSVTAYALKYTVRRAGPDQSSDPNAWGQGGGNSFPSWHSTAAFAVGTVLAESGNDEYRWVRRLLGYGLGAATSYERLKHNAHWLSDTVAGAALGAASARFAMKRSAGSSERAAFAIEPQRGGAMLTYRMVLP
jgi:membrane-associated phospholipid phosphatase